MRDVPASASGSESTAYSAVPDVAVPDVAVPDVAVTQDGVTSPSVSRTAVPSPATLPPSSGATRLSVPRDLGPSELIAKHQRGVWRYLRLLGCDPATADDLTQETFLRVLRRNNFVQHNDQATAGYLRRTAYNLLVSRHRKLGRVLTVGETSVLDETWDRWAGKDGSGDAAVDALRDCMETLTPRARRAIEMRFAEEASRVEIGDALGITDHGARNLMQRAKQQLRECVDEKLRQADLR